MSYKVIETPCFPSKFKVESVEFPGSNNSTHLYFRDKVEAQKLCDTLNDTKKRGRLEDREQAKKLIRIINDLIYDTEDHRNGIDDVQQIHDLVDEVYS